MKKPGLLICSTTAALLLACGLAAGGDYDNAWRSGGSALAGAWEVETTVRMNADDCTSAPLVPPFAPNPFPSFYAFHDGGTMTEQGSRSPPSNRSTGFGVWERAGRQQYVSLVKFQSFDENGLLAAIIEIRSEMSLAKNAESFEGLGHLTRTDISGNSMTFCVTMTGERMSL
ncbi:MAG: hypothetical protein OEW73_07585 [Gammaproteobacteria bacterium]|nr:hypothetical protein [Gammaproteobacteria bacterium]MDH5240628.1 hypothetical protein [Gammaproteobacteria bacterium]MDH5262657.1 hypothetical protein [Gammaproteobacteria bacterium]MDH5582835.1 hypothetical protein [Gammaproteobacteria bacterium]